MSKNYAAGRMEFHPNKAVKKYRKVELLILVQ